MSFLHTWDMMSLYQGLPNNVFMVVKFHQNVKKRPLNPGSTCIGSNLVLGFSKPNV
jgi:hypothetical protein